MYSCRCPITNQRDTTAIVWYRIEELTTNNGGFEVSYNQNIEQVAKPLFVHRTRFEKQNLELFPNIKIIFRENY